VHAALEARAGEERPALEAVLSAPLNPNPNRASRTWISAAALLVAICLSQADGLLYNVVPFERDTSAYYYPLMAWAATQLQHGIFPLWNPTMFSGYPIFADGEVGLAYPPVLLALLTLSADRALVLLRVIHLAIAALGAFWLARTWRLPHAAATLAGVTFALGSFFQAQIHHENIVRTAAWLPVILACLEEALRSRRGHRRIWTGATALALGMAGLSLHSQLLAMELMVLAAYCALRWAIGPIAGASTPLSRLLMLLAVSGPATAIGIAIAAVQLLPLAELASVTPRGSGIPYVDSAAYSLTPLGLAQLIFPFVFRTPQGQQWGLWTHWESYLYVGLVPLLLAGVALICVWRQEVLLWLILGSIALVTALGQYSPINLHYQLWMLPGLSSLRAPGRFTLVVILALAMLSAYGLAWLGEMARGDAPANGARGPTRADRILLRGTLVACALLPVALVVLLAWIHTGLVTDPTGARVAIEQTYLSLPHDTYRLTPTDVYNGMLAATDPLANPRAAAALLGLVAIAAVLLVWQLGPWPRVRRWPGWPGLLVAATLADLLLFGWGIHPRNALATLTRPQPVTASLVSTSAEATRVMASPVINQVAPNRQAPLGLDDVNGYSSLPSRWQQIFLGRVLSVDDRLLDLWGIQYVIDPAHFGQVASYKGVEFVTGQAQLESGAGGAGDEATFAINPVALRDVGMVMSLADAVELEQGTPVGEVQLLDAGGNVVGQYELQAGRDTMEWAWDNPYVQPQVKHQRVEVAGVAYEGGPDGQRLLSYTHFSVAASSPVTTVRIRAVPPHGQLTVLGVALTADDGNIQQLLGRHQTKYQEVYRDGLVAAYANRAAFPRAFYVRRARVADSSEQAFSTMTQAPFDPAQEVVLIPDESSGPVSTPSSSEDRSAGAASDGPLGGTIVSATPGETVVNESAPGDGYLVLTDAYYPGWHASVDGTERPIVRADLLFRAVAVPAGTHTVRFWFDPFSVKRGLAITALGVLVALGLLVSGRVRRRRSGARAGAQAGPALARVP
jgi:hypothetical protein